MLLHTLSKHRPRWIVELSSVAARHAAARKSKVIERKDVFEELREFGKRRLVDTVAEFRSACPEVEEILAAFSRGAEEYSTAELLDTVGRKVLNHVNPRISGVLGQVDVRDVAAFLYEIGFFYARRDFADESYEHITFSDRPSLLKARTNIDDGVRWEIHPAYRTALEMRDPAGFELVDREERIQGGLVRRRPVR